MANTLLTVEEAAQALKLHPKTVLRYIREERLPATRVGKGYRIGRDQLSAFAGLPLEEKARVPKVQTTAIVEIAEIGAERAERLAGFVGSAAVSGARASHPLHASTAFDPDRGSLKIVLLGLPDDVARLLELIELHSGCAQ